MTRFAKLIHSAIEGPEKKHEAYMQVILEHK